MCSSCRAVKCFAEGVPRKAPLFCLGFNAFSVLERATVEIMGEESSSVIIFSIMSRTIFGTATFSRMPRETFVDTANVGLILKSSLSWPLPERAVQSLFGVA